MRAYVTIRRKVRAQGKLDKRHSIQESSSKHNAKKLEQQNEAHLISWSMPFL